MLEEIKKFETVSAINSDKSKKIKNKQPKNMIR